MAVLRTVADASGSDRTPWHAERCYRRGGSSTYPRIGSAVFDAQRPSFASSPLASSEKEMFSFRPRATTGLPCGSTRKPFIGTRSEERRVGKEGRGERARGHGE